MCQLVESIMVKNGWFYNLDLHEERMNNSMKKVFYANEYVELEDLLYSYLSKWIENNGENSINGKVKCRVIYDKNVLNITFDIYKLRTIKTLKVVYDNKIDYSIKTVDRSELNKLYELRENCDDILIIKNGLVTDTWAANVLFYDGIDWFTPRLPLLHGIKRQLLLNLEIIKEADIKLNDIEKYQKLRLVNAMIDFEDEVDIPIENIKV